MKPLLALSGVENAAIENLKNARQLFESYLQGVFEKKGDGWEEKRFLRINPRESNWTYKKHQTTR